MTLTMAPACTTLGVLALFAAVSATACGSRPTGRGGDAAVEVELTEWSVKSSRPSTASGPVVIEVKNGGKLGHELVVIKTELSPATLPAIRGFVDEREAGQVVGRTSVLARGRRQTQTFDLSPGRYALICNVVGHYQMGMRTGLEVRP